MGRLFCGNFTATPLPLYPSEVAGPTTVRPLVTIAKDDGRQLGYVNKDPRTACQVEPMVAPFTEKERVVVVRRAVRRADDLDGSSEVDAALPLASYEEANRPNSV